MSSAYTVYFFALAFVATSFIWLMLSNFTNEFIIVINPMISDGMFSSLFVQNFNFVVNVFTAIPLISLFALIIWSIVHVIEEKGSGA